MVRKKLVSGEGGLCWVENGCHTDTYVCHSIDTDICQGIGVDVCHGIGSDVCRSIGSDRSVPVLISVERSCVSVCVHRPRCKYTAFGDVSV